MDDNKKDSDSGCEMTVIRHGEDCPVTKGFREMADQIVGQAGEAADAENTGPAKWNSKAYKNGWDSVFGSRQEIGEA